jgi:hypothetical protein
MSPTRLLRFLLVFALLFAPISMMGSHAAMAMPATPTPTVHHQPDMAMAGHCADMGGQSQQDQQGSTSPGIDCMIACSIILAAAGDMAERPPLVATPYLPLPWADHPGRNPEAEPPPPRFFWRWISVSNDSTSEDDMKTYAFFAAAALVAATPAAAQTAPANPHQGHDRGQVQGHAGHAQHGQTQNGQSPGGQQTPHQGHAARDCCADRNGNGRMDCCETMTEGQRCCEEQRPAAQPGGAHQGHRNK